MFKLLWLFTSTSGASAWFKKMTAGCSVQYTNLEFLKHQTVNRIIIRIYLFSDGTKPKRSSDYTERPAV